MLSIRPSNPQRCIPNLLPARINHNGPINDAERYWKPETDDKGKRHSYFRGRHLHGTALPLPNNYTGAILRVTDQQLPQSQTQPQQPPADEDDEDAETEESIPVEVNIAEQVGEFDQVIVWGHGGEVDGSGDAFIRGMSEWVGFAESMHIDEEEKDKGTKPGGQYRLRNNIEDSLDLDQGRQNRGQLWSKIPEVLRSGLIVLSF